MKNVTKKKSDNSTREGEKSKFCRSPCPTPGCVGVCNRPKGHSGLHRCPAGHTWAAGVKRCGAPCPVKGCKKVCWREKCHGGRHHCPSSHRWPKITC